MLFLRSALALLVATFLQIVLQQLGNLWGRGVASAVDLLLVVVVWIALASGPGAGQIVGMVAGFLADGLAGGLYGLQAIANTVVGYGAAVVRQRVVLQRGVLILVFAGAALVQQLVVALLQFLLVAEPEVASLPSVLARVVATAAVGALLLSLEGRVQSGWRGWQRRRHSRLRLR